MRWVVCVVGVLVLGLAACSKSNEGGGTPTGPTTTTRVMRIEAGLEFGDVAVGSTADRVLRIYNDGNAAINVTGLTGPSGYTASWTNGSIAPGTSQAATVRFSPTEARSYSGTVTVNADHTSGTNTTPISGRGVSASPAPIPTPSPAISGTVREEGTSIAIGGATVIVKDTSFSTNSDGSGRYGIAAVPNGNYMLRATASGYALTERTVSVNGSATADILMRKVSAPPPTPNPAPSPGPSPTPPPGADTCSASSYPSSAGCGTPTAVCNDGTLSCSQNRPGTCSSHGGKKCWLCPGILCNGLTGSAAPAEGPLFSSAPMSVSPVR
jgi:hypothetical protein